MSITASGGAAGGDAAGDAQRRCRAGVGLQRAVARAADGAGLRAAALRKTASGIEHRQPVGAARGLRQQRRRQRRDRQRIDAEHAQRHALRRRASSA